MRHKRSIKEKLFKGGSWVFVGKVVTVLTGMVINILLARLLTPEEMGAYFLVLSLVAVATGVAQLGLTQTIVRLVAESMAAGQPSRARRSVVLVLRMVTVSGVVVASVLAFGGGSWVSERLFHSEIMSNVTGLVAVWGVLWVFHGLISEVYRGFHDIRLATIFGGLVTSVVSMGLFSTLWWFQGYSDLHQIILLTLVAGGSSLAFSSVILWKKLSVLPSSTDEQISAAEIMTISWPLWITSLTFLVLFQADLWIMGLFRTSEEVAVYGAAARLVALVAIPLLIVNAVVPPLIAEMSIQGKIKELEKTLRTAATFTGLPAIVFLGIFFFAGGFVLKSLFGSYYQTGGVVLAILSIGQLVNVWAGSCGQVLMLTGNQVSMMYITVFCGLFTTVLAWLLVPQYGGVGVASAACIGMVLQNILMLFSAKKKTGVWTHVSFSKLNLIFLLERVK